MTSKRSTPKRAAPKKSHEAVVTTNEIKRPKDELMLEVRPAIGPNTDEFAHQIQAAHAIDESALASRRNHIAPPEENNQARREET